MFKLRLLTVWLSRQKDILMGMFVRRRLLALGIKKATDLHPLTALDIAGNFSTWCERFPDATDLQMESFLSTQVNRAILNNV